MYIFSGNSRKVIFSRDDIRAFMAQWPCHGMQTGRHYWFEFDSDGDLIDTDVPEHSDGPAAAALADDALEYLNDGIVPVYATDDSDA